MGEPVKFEAGTIVGTALGDDICPSCMGNVYSIPFDELNPEIKQALQSHEALVAELTVANQKMLEAMASRDRLRKALEQIRSTYQDQTISPEGQCDIMDDYAKQALTGHDGKGVGPVPTIAPGDEGADAALADKGGK